MAEDNTEDSSDSRTPLDELRRSIEDQPFNERRQPEIWEVLEGRLGDESVNATAPKGEALDRPVAEMSSPSQSVQTTPTSTETGRRWFPTYPSRSVYVIHGVLTTIIFTASFGIYVGAVLSLIPRHLWIVSLPLFALGVFFLTPMISWSLGIWNPTKSV